MLSIVIFISNLKYREMNFVDLVMKARPQIKENSAKAYATSLKLLAPENAENLTEMKITR